MNPKPPPPPASLDAELSFRAIVDAQADMVSLAQGDGTLIYVNRAYAREFGRAPQAMIGLSLYGFVDAQDVAAVRARLTQVYETGASTRSENRMRFADGSERWVAWTNGVLAVGDRRLLHSVGQDITPRRGLEQALAASERFLRQLADSIPLRIAYLDRDRRYRFVNRCLLENLGRPRAEVLGRTRAELLDGDDATLAGRAALALAGAPQQFEFDEIVDGRTRRFENRLIPDRDAEGRVRGLFVTGIDITARAQAERDLRTLTAIFDATTDFVVQTDFRGQLTYMNPAARWRCGLAADADIAHRHITELTPPQTVERHLREILPRAIEQGVWIGETVQWDAQRRDVPCSHMVIAHRNEAGRVERFSIILRDITAEKRAQSALEHSASTLRSLAEFNQTILRNSPVAMGVYAAGGRCVQVNDAYARLVGAPREALLEQNFHDIASWRQSELLADCLAALRTMQPQRREIQVVSTFGKRVWVVCELFPIELNEEKHLLVQLIDLTEQKRLETELRLLAFEDPLTRLPNRRLLMDRLEQALRLCKRRGTLGAVLYIDLTKFKQLNDAHGHAVGDQWLVEVATRLVHAVRETDTVARIGGDEFVVLLEGLGPERDRAAARAAEVAATIRSGLGEAFVVGAIRHRGSASIGLRLLGGEDQDAESILREADRSMYAEKRGRAG
ncbi:MAG: PAS domain S-box protein [Burkholderiales bacterium]|nr:PAS domain S-box protein [Burkholderiales bacterium]